MNLGSDHLAVLRVLYKIWLLNSVVSCLHCVYVFPSHCYLMFSFRPRTWMCSTPAPCWRRVMTFCSSGLLVWWWWASNWLASCPSKRWDHYKLLNPEHKTTGCRVSVVNSTWLSDIYFLTGLSTCSGERRPRKEDEQVSWQRHWPTGRHYRNLPGGEA